MKAIFKYPIPVLEKFSVSLPADAQVIRVDDVDGHFFLWAIVDTEADLVERHFECYKTGQPIETPLHRLFYLGLCKLFIMQELGLYVFEVFHDAE